MINAAISAEINILFFIIKRNNMKFLTSLFIISLFMHLWADTRGLKIMTKENELFELPYANSYALLIGVSDYTNGWPDIESIPRELDKVAKALEAQGFKITKVLDPAGAALFDSFEEFIDRYGYDPNNRLIIFYSGHGYTSNHGKKGYLVPADAPNPNENLRDFKRVAMNMDRVITLSREMESKHALFLFDSCFSGTIFKTKALPKTPPYIEKSMSRAVRQYITAGSADEEVPANSTFTPMFIDAIEGKADLNRDKYVTGSELGLYMTQTLPNFTSQSPQYGKIHDYDLAQGDFIFVPKKTAELLTMHALSIDITPADAEIMIEPLHKRYTADTKLKEGTYTLNISKPGYLSKTIKVNMERAMMIQVFMQKAPPQVPNHPLTIRTNPAGASIALLDQNGQYAYADGMAVRAGRYTVKVSKNGYPTKTIQLDVNQRTDITIDLELPKHPVHIRTLPADASITIADAQSRYHYYEGMNLPEGSYTVTVSKEGYHDLTTTVNVQKWMDVTLRLEEYRHPVFIRTVPSGASVMLLGKKQYTYRDGVMVPEGRYTVKVSKGGYHAKTTTITVDGRTDVTLELEKIVENARDADEDDAGEPQMFIGF